MRSAQRTRVIKGKVMPLHKLPFKQGIQVFFLLLILFSFACHSAPAAQPLSLPLRFHIITHLTMNKNNVEMHNWVTKRDIKRRIVPEINRIWRSSKISFVVEDVFYTQALQPANKEKLIDKIVHSHRNSRGKSDPSRIRKLDQLLDWQTEGARVINVYLIPYLGEASQGHTKIGERRIYLAQWSDKHSPTKIPVRFRLIEQPPYKKGSLSRTLAHELGHILGLKHPDKSTQHTFHLLMGGKKPGYTITREEQIIAQAKAAELLQALMNN